MMLELFDWTIYGKHNIFQVTLLCLVLFLEILIVVPFVLRVHNWRRLDNMSLPFCVLEELWGNTAKIFQS